MSQDINNTVATSKTRRVIKNLRWYVLVLFLLGWIMIGATSMSVTALAIFATAVAFIFVMAQGEAKPVVTAPANVEEEDDCYEE